MKKNNLHPGFRTSKSGLVLSVEQPGLAASPNGFFECECHGRGVIEAKCCWSHRNEKILDVIQSRNDFYLLPNTEFPEYSFVLRTTHPYYYQVQQQMLVPNSSYCLFMVYTDVEIAISLVTRDEVVCLEIKEKRQKFFAEVLLPKMVAEWFVKTDYIPAI